MPRDKTKGDRPKSAAPRKPAQTGEKRVPEQVGPPEKHRQMSGKRDNERVPIAGQVTGEVMVFQPMTILDISRGGAQIETPFPLQLDSLHEFRLTLGDRSIVVKGRIAHCHIGELTETSALYRTGVEFIEPSDHAMAAISDFIDSLKARSTHPAIVDADIVDE
jgi:hypothetical protein